MPTIKFTDITAEVPPEFYPVPAKLSIPTWLKELAPYMDKNFKVLEGRQTNQTAKRCVPMLDAVTSGYVIKLTHDLEITQQNGAPYFKWPAGLGIDFHSANQVSTHQAAKDKHAIPKWNNPFSIETPAGYSCLFIPHLNTENKIITPFAGIVDTDSYIAPVNFPFQLQKRFEGLIPAGTPIVQVIPFRRDEWKMEIAVGQTEKIRLNGQRVFSAFRNAYRNAFWSRKSFN